MTNSQSEPRFGRDGNGIHMFFPATARHGAHTGNETAELLSEQPLFIGAKLRPE